MKTLPTKFEIEDEVFELLQKHLRALDMTLDRFVTVLVHARMTELVASGSFPDAPSTISEALIREFVDLSSAKGSPTHGPRAEDLVELGANVEPGLYRAQMRVIGSAQ